MPNKVINLEVTPPDSAQKHIRRPNPLDYILKSVNGRSSHFLRRRSFQAAQNSECSPVPVSPMEVDSSAVLVRFPLFMLWTVLLFYSSVKFILFVNIILFVFILYMVSVDGIRTWYGGRI